MSQSRLPVSFTEWAQWLRKATEINDGEYDHADLSVIEALRFGLRNFNDHVIDKALKRLDAIAAKKGK